MKEEERTFKADFRKLAVGLTEDFDRISYQFREVFSE